MFEKNDKVIKIISVGGSLTATLQVVDSVKNNKVLLVDGVTEFYLDTGKQIENWIPGCTSYIVPLDGDEEDHMRGILGVKGPAKKIRVPGTRVKPKPKKKK